MDQNRRPSKRRSALQLEALETRNLLSVLLNNKPTLEVIPSGGRVRPTDGAISIIQPTPIIVTGTAQPPTPNITIRVDIFAQDANGNLVNGGAPLATATPDFLGRYTTSLVLPSRLQRDVNSLVARVTATGVLQSSLQINPTTISGLNGNLAIDATALRNLAAALNLDPGTLSDFTATISNPNGSSTLTGTVVTPATPISGIGGTITTPLFPISTPDGAGTAGPAVSTLLGGFGTLGTQVGTITGGSSSSPASTSTLSDGSGTESARTGTLSAGIGTIDPTTGTFTQAGTAAVAAATGIQTLAVQEVAVSDPITVLIHQSQGIPGASIRAKRVRDDGPAAGIPRRPLRATAPKPIRATASHPMRATAPHPMRATAPHPRGPRQ